MLMEEMTMVLMAMEEMTMEEEMMMLLLEDNHSHLLHQHQHLLLHEHHLQVFWDSVLFFFDELNGPFLFCFWCYELILLWFWCYGPYCMLNTTLLLCVMGLMACSIL
jgi:hypothetical protein